MTLLTPGIGQIGWEINQLGPGGREQLAERSRPKCATCTKNLSVQVENGCHYGGSVNYVIFGLMMRLCHDYYEAADRGWKAYWHDKDWAIDLVAMHKTRTGLPAANLRAVYGVETEWLVSRAHRTPVIAIHGRHVG